MLDVSLFLTLAKAWEERKPCLHSHTHRGWSFCYAELEVKEEGYGSGFKRYKLLLFLPSVEQIFLNKCVFICCVLLGQFLGTSSGGYFLFVLNNFHYVCLTRKQVREFWKLPFFFFNRGKIHKMKQAILKIQFGDIQYIHNVVPTTT